MLIEENKPTAKSSQTPAQESERAEHAHIKNTIYELINQGTAEKFCKQYCYDNRRHFQCTLDHAWGSHRNDDALCEWGNATLVWMLEDLYTPRRIEKLGETFDIITVKKYFNKIIHSIPFRERFKDWRFQRRIQVPNYIKAIDPDAHKVFWWLCDQDEVANIAQRLGRADADIERIAGLIRLELNRRKRDHLLKPSVILSIVNVAPEEDGTAIEIPHEDEDPESTLQKQQVRQAFHKLDWLEQFVLDSMVVEELSANAVLDALVKQGVSVREDVAVEELNIQHVYYFLRKTVIKLKNLVNQ